MTGSELTVVLSRSPGDDPDKRRREQEVIAALREAGCAHVTAIPHVYYLYPDDPVVRALEAASGDLVVLAWLYPRATEWILRQDGISAGSGRRVLCFDLRGERGAAELAAEVRNATDAEAVGVVPLTKADADRMVARRWYPVLDFERCSNCLECIDFCLFGVYGIDDAGTCSSRTGTGAKRTVRRAALFARSARSSSRSVRRRRSRGAPEDEVETDEADSIQLGSMVTLTIGGRRDPEPVAAGEDELDKLIDDLEDVNP